MSKTELPHRRYPCSECPWRRDTTPGQFCRSRFDALAATAGTAGNEADFDSPMFACHKSPEGNEEACAGWLATVGVDHLGVRLAIATRRLDPSALERGPGWPPLFTTYTEMTDTQAKGPNL
jgi:hypothetical protein